VPTSLILRCDPEAAEKEGASFEARLETVVQRLSLSKASLEGRTQPEAHHVACIYVGTDLPHPEVRA
jgi:hypothetical protein